MGWEVQGPPLGKSAFRREKCPARYLLRGSAAQSYFGGVLSLGSLMLPLTEILLPSSGFSPPPTSSTVKLYFSATSASVLVGTRQGGLLFRSKVVLVSFTPFRSVFNSTSSTVASAGPPNASCKATAAGASAAALLMRSLIGKRDRIVETVLSSTWAEASESVPSDPSLISAWTDPIAGRSTL